MPPADLAAYRTLADLADPGWPTLRPFVREMWAEARQKDAGPEHYAAIRDPVLQIVGGESGPLFTDGTWALDRLLAHGRVVVIPGARRAAHRTHPDRFVAEVRAFLEGDLPFEHD